MTNTRISLWSGPRNISTALMYSFAQREDTRVYDEPLYAYYLRNSPAQAYHPGASEILATMENDGDRVVEQMLGSHGREVAFFKNMTHHLLDLDRSFMKKMVNVILTRDPLEMLPSFAKVIEQPSIDDVGYALHLDLLEYFRTEDIPFVVMDGTAFLKNPEGVLRQLCEFAGISFQPQMLHWEAGPRPEDGCWAKYWYDSVHRSTGFAKYQPKTAPFPEHLTPLLERCQPCYERLMEYALR